jgi:hypothetical protein
VNFVVYIEKLGPILVLYGNLENWINDVVIIYFLTKDTVNSSDFVEVQDDSLKKLEKMGKKSGDCSE